ncbi:MAG: RHS repeat protein, partial [Saprospiraceae bacterium]|nr:RHS repeat protein [Saprospiraceae bacterium]
NLRNKVHKGICAVTGHPVDIATGKVFTEITDFELPGPIPLVWERTWYSTSAYNGPLGHGWHHTYDLYLANDPETNGLIIRMADGRNIFFPALLPGEAAYNQQEKLQLTREEGGYVLTGADRLRYRFGEPLGNSTARQPLLRIEDTAGFFIEFQYDGRGFPERIRDSAGRILTVQTDASGRITAISAPHPDHAGGTLTLVQYRYDPNGNLAEALDAQDKPFSYFYQKHLLVQETNRNGLSFYFEYDGADESAWCIRTWGDGGIYDHKLTYQKAEKWTVVENSLGHKTTYYWNDDGLVFKTIDPFGHEQLTRYGDFCQVTAQTDELGSTTFFTYDKAGNQTATQYPDGSTLMMAYDENLLLAVTDQNGGKWQWSYNEAGQLIQRINPLGIATQYSYQNGLLHAVTDALSGVTRLTYDTQHNLIALTTPDGATSRWEYDALGRCTKSTDPKGNAQNRLFNLLGWVERVVEPDGNIRQLDYDAEGNVVRARDQHHDVRFEYKGMNRLKARTEAGTRVEFAYNTEEDLTGIVNEHGYAYRFELDARGDVTTESGFDGLTRRYLRDAAGRVVEVKRPGGLSTRYEYDPMGRVTAVQHSDGSNESYAYRPDGELMEAANQHIGVKFERDPLGRVLREIQGGFVVDSVYDKLGMRTEVRSSLGAHLTFGRDIMGDVEKVSANGAGKPWEATFKRDSLGLETERLLPGGVRSRWERDKLGRPIRQEMFAGGGKPARSRTYTWDVNDRLKQIADDQKGIVKFEHDAFGNLASAQYGDGSFEFRMPDAVGNLFRSKDQKDRKYGPAGQLLEANGTRYEYDPEGNLIKKTEPNGATWHYEWNAAGMLRRVVRPDGDTVTFTYDALGRRISKQYRGKTTRWVWDGNNILHEWIETAPPSPEDTPRPAMTTHAGGLIKIKRRDEQLATAPANAPPQETLAPGKTELFTDYQPTSQPVNQSTNQPVIQSTLTTWVFEPETFAPLAKLSNGMQYSIVTDHLGTPVSMFSDSGERVWDMDLSIYGEVRQLQGWREACPFRYPGQYEDVETGLYYNQLRYFDPINSIYLSQDPIDLLGSLRLYSYVDDPNLWIDPFGLKKCGPKPKPLYKTKLKKSDFKKSDAFHFRTANEALYKRMKKDPKLKAKLEKQYPGIYDHVKPGPRGGIKSTAPPGTTWHHSPDSPGTLELVDRADHKTNHSIYHPDGEGGRAVWGGGSDYR